MLLPERLSSQPLAARSVQLLAFTLIFFCSVPAFSQFETYGEEEDDSRQYSLVLRTRPLSFAYWPVTSGAAFNVNFEAEVMRDSWRSFAIGFNYYSFDSPHRVVPTRWRELRMVSFNFDNLYYLDNNYSSDFFAGYYYKYRLRLGIRQSGSSSSTEFINDILYGAIVGYQYVRYPLVLTQNLGAGLGFGIGDDVVLAWDVRLGFSVGIAIF